MLASKKTKRGVIGAIVLAGVLAVSGYALTDVLVVPTNSHAGDGDQAIENVEVTAGTLHYVLDGTDPSLVDAIEFELDQVIDPDGAIWVQPVDTGNGGSSVADFWYACTLNTLITDTIVCDTTTGATPAPAAQLEAVDIDQVRVVAAD